MILRNFIIVLLSVFTSVSASAFKISVRVIDTADAQPIEFAAVSWSRGNDNTGGITSENGICLTSVSAGQWTLSVSCIGYRNHTEQLTIEKDDEIVVSLEKSDVMLNDVVVTAREGTGMTSTSVIDRQAMEHLQPSSFTDLLELLPGEVSHDPKMGEVNIANLRSAAGLSEDFMTSSLGTSFVVDGVPMNVNSDLTASPESSRDGRSAVGRGVDMRELSTDDIESVEIVRGIASAEYGEITGGLINIKRKNRASAFEARFKADEQSQLFYVGKGVELPKNWNLNFSADFLNSKIDPRNNRENFKRVNASVRSMHEWKTNSMILNWESSINYMSTFERDNNDPDLTVNNTIDYYRTDKNQIGWNNSFTVKDSRHGFFDNFAVTTGITYGYEHLQQQKTIAPSRIYPLPVSTDPGSNYIGFLPMLYVADFDLYSKPVTAFAKAVARFRYSFKDIDNTLRAGLEWGFNKNYGRGEVYDLTRPLLPGNNTRPRPFSDIPAMNRLSFYAENLSEFGIGQNRVQFQAGLRETQLVGIPGRYKINNRPYLDPRLNLKWIFPGIFIGENPVDLSVGGGYGIHTKMPVAAQLFPDMIYTDYVQLNYYHDNPDWRVMNVMTFVEDVTNYELEAARNHKWEVHADASFCENRLSVTYFRENMNNGFRSDGTVHFYTYSQYDASGYNPALQNRPPEINELPYKDVTRLRVVGRYNNGSRTLKEGVEFTLRTLRIPYIRTRLTINGAYFRTTLDNSCAQWYHPSVIVNGDELPYAGLYDDADGSVYKSFNTNFLLDTDIPSLKLNFSVGIQNMWFTSRQTLFKTGVPSYYIDAEGNVGKFTSDMASDPLLGQLIRSYSPTVFETRRIPSETSFNIKATKKMWKDRIAIAVYVNRLLTIAPDYYSFGILQRRHYSPYFGMELNLKF